MKDLEKILINVSSTFLPRARCKKCFSPPINSSNTHFFVKEPSFGLSPNDHLSRIKYMQNITNRFCESYYLYYSPSAYISTSTFNYALRYKGYQSRLHKNIGTSLHNELVEFLTCKCGRTTWSFKQKCIENKPEIKNRKGKIGY